MLAEFTILHDNETLRGHLGQYLRAELLGKKYAVSQRVLSIDTTIRPCQALLIDVEGKDFKIIDSRVIDLDQDRLENKLEQTDEQSSPPWLNSHNPLLNLREKFNSSWHFASVLISPRDYLTINLSLPFSSAKELAQVIPGEVQDQVPMSIDDFHLQYDVRGTYADSQTEVRVQLVGKQFLDNLLLMCKQAQIEPSLILAPGAVLPMVLPLTRFGDLTRAHAIIHSAQDWVVLNIYAADSYRSEHLFHHNNDITVTIPQINRCLKWAEERYETSIRTIFYIGPSQGRDILELLLKRKVTYLILPPQTPASHVLNTLAALAAQEKAPYSPYGNFRSGKYRYNPHFTFALQRLRVVAPFFFGAMLTLCLCALAVYAFREYQINQYNVAVQNKIREVIPDINVPAGTESAGLRGKIRQLEEQLEALGAFLDTSPLDTLALIAKHFPIESDIELTLVNINHNAVIIKGSAPDHSTVESIRQSLKKKRRYFCNVKKQSSAKSGNAIAFEFALEICK